MAKYTENTKKNTDLHQQMPAQNPTPEVVRQSIQQYTLENDQATTHTHRKFNGDGNLQKPSPVKLSSGTPQGRGKEVGHETSGKETRNKKQRRWDTPGEKWRGWPRTENGVNPWSMAYAPSEQTGISKYVQYIDK